MATLTIKPTAAGNDVQIKSGDGNTTHATFGDTSTVNMSAGSIASAVTGTLGSGITFPAGHILQVVSTTKTDDFDTTASYTSSNGTDIPGQGGSGVFSVTITPSSTSNKIWVTSTLNGSQAVGTNRVSATMYRDSTKIFVGDQAGSRLQFSGGYGGSNSTIHQAALTVNFLDSPSTTSAVVYKWKVGTHGAGTAFINRTEQDSNDSITGRLASTITVMEIKV